jgi:hypothetical protein
MKTSPHRHLFSYFLVLTSALLSACASRTPIPPDYNSIAGYVPSNSYQPAPIAGAPAIYRSTYQDSNIASRQLVPMSDGEAAKQPAGTTHIHKTETGETVIKNGKVKKQSSTTEEVIETNTTTTIDSISVPTSDQDTK